MSKNNPKHVGASGGEMPMDAYEAPKKVTLVADDGSVTFNVTEHPPEKVVAERYQAGCLAITVNTPPEQWPSSMAKGTREWEAAVVNCQCTPDVEVTHEWSEPFTVRHWLVMVREGVDDKTGEIRQYPWLALICDDGSIVGTSSEVVPHQLARALRSVPAERWERGVTFKIRRRMSRSTGRSYHELRMVP